jgi:hypothetical protein
VGERVGVFDGAPVQVGVAVPIGTEACVGATVGVGVRCEPSTRRTRRDCSASAVMANVDSPVEIARYLTTSGLLSSTSVGNWTQPDEYLSRAIPSSK